MECIAACPSIGSATDFLWPGKLLSQVFGPTVLRAFRASCRSDKHKELQPGEIRP